MVLKLKSEFALDRKSILICFMLFINYWVIMWGPYDKSFKEPLWRFICLQFNLKSFENVQSTFQRNLDFIISWCQTIKFLATLIIKLSIQQFFTFFSHAILNCIIWLLCQCRHLTEFTKSQIKLFYSRIN